MATAGAIIIAPANFLLLVNSIPIDDWPGSGTACELARVGPISTHTPAFGGDTFVIGVPQYTLTINVQIGSKSDNALENSVRAFVGARRPWSVSATREGQPLFSTIVAGPTTEPPITLSVDSQPVRSWVVGLRLDTLPTGGLFIVKEPLDAATVQSFAP